MLHKITVKGTVRISSDNTKAADICARLRKLLPKSLDTMNCEDKSTLIRFIGNSYTLTSEIAYTVWSLLHDLPEHAVSPSRIYFIDGLEEMKIYCGPVKDIENMQSIDAFNKIYVMCKALANKELLSLKDYVEKLIKEREV